MLDGKKSLVTTMVYNAIDIISEKTGKDGVEVLEQAIKNVSPVMEVRPRRVGGATYRFANGSSPDRRLTLAIRWIITSTRARSGKSFSEKLAGELMDTTGIRALLFAARRNAQNGRGKPSLLPFPHLIFVPYQLDY